MHATSYILSYRGSGDPARHANLVAVLQWLKLQQLAEIILVEQDVASTLVGTTDVQGVRSVFAYNPGPFNKSWGFNIGTRLARGSLLAFGDADTMCRGLPAAIAASRSGIPVLRAFPGLTDLDAEQSDMLRDDLSCLADPSFALAAQPDRVTQGEHLPLCSGVVIFQRAYVSLLGGWDERFHGWGGEDDAMTVKVERAGLPLRIAANTQGFHLHHRRADAALAPDALYRGNLAILAQLRTMPDTALKRMCEIAWQIAGNPDMHRPMEKLA